MVHCLSDLGDLDQTFMRQMSTILDHGHAPREALEIVPLRGLQRMLAEERDDRLREIPPSADVVLTKVLLVVVVPLVDEDAANPEEAPELFEAARTSCALRNDEPMEHLIAGCVALPALPAWLPDETDREASFSVYKAENPAKLNQSFLLVFRTRHVVTMLDVTSDVTR